MGGLGTCGYPHPRRCDPRPVEAFAAVEASHLGARGAFVGAGTVTRWQYPGFVITVIVEHSCRVAISIDDHQPVAVDLIFQGFGQLLFVCPDCGRWRRNLYVKD